MFIAPPSSVSIDFFSEKSIYEILTENISPFEYTEIVRYHTLKQFTITILETPDLTPLVVLMNIHCGSRKAWQLAHLMDRITKPGILVRLDHHRDLVGIQAYDVRTLPRSIDDLRIDRFNNVNFTVPVIFQRLIDEIYIIEKDSIFNRPRTIIKCLCYIEKDNTVELVDENSTRLRNGGVEIFTKIPVHYIPHPAYMPDLSNDDRPLLWDTDIDFYFFIRKNIDLIYQRLMLTEKYLQKVNRTPDVFTFALSTEVTTEPMSLTPPIDLHVSVLHAWIELLRKRNIEFLGSKDDDVPSVILFDQIPAYLASKCKVPGRTGVGELQYAL